MADDVQLLILGNGSNLHFDLKTTWKDYWNWRKSEISNENQSSEMMSDFIFRCAETMNIPEYWKDVENLFSRIFGVAFEYSSVVGVHYFVENPNNPTNDKPIFEPYALGDSFQKLFWDWFLKCDVEHHFEIGDSSFFQGYCLNQFDFFNEQMNLFESSFCKYLISALGPSFYNQNTEYSNFLNTLMNMVDVVDGAFDI